MTRFAPTALSAMHLAEGSDPYFAPELTALKADPVYLDVYGLGVLTYLLVTGKAPAASQAELLARLEAGEGLRPSSLVDDLSEDIDFLVQAATAYRPGQRLSSVDEFLEMLEIVEDTLTAPTSAPDPEPAEDPEKDPLEAVAGDVLGGRWEVRRRLGTGSTSRAFLVRDLQAEARKTRPLAVLKVALSDSRGQVLVHEAEVMNRLRPDSRVIRLVEPEPLRIGPRTVLALEYVGDEREATDQGTETTDSNTGTRTRTRTREETVARQLREHGRLKMDQLEAYGDYLFGAVDFLEGESVWHRDIKPDNIAIRIRPNRTRELVLIDFSLAGYPAKDYEAGTDGYLDPFIGTLTRTAYDSHAERYAIAVTLHQMASRELPRWGDGSVPPRMTDPKEFPYPTVQADAFEPAVRDGLVAFFRKALHRDAAKRFAELKPMRDAWKKIFLDASQTVPSSHRSRHPEPAPQEPVTGERAATIADAEPLTADEQRERLAAAVTRDTHLSAAGLTPAAEAFLYSLEITTVGGLLDYSRSKLLNAPGLGTKTRTEVQRRQRQWGRLLREAPLSPLTPKGRAEAKEELAQLTATESAVAGALAVGEGAAGLSESALRSVSLDLLATLFVPELNNNRSNSNKVEMVRLLLRLPDERGELPGIGVWPKQKDVAEALGLSAGRIPQMLKEERKRWKKHPAVQALRDEIVGLLVSLGRVASAVEIADALAVRRGTQLAGREQRRALALAAVRAVVEVEQLQPEEAEFQHQANRKATEDVLAAGLLALDVREIDAPDTPTAPGLLDYATRLGRTADRLTRLETLPTATTVLSELGALTPSRCRGLGRTATGRTGRRRVRQRGCHAPPGDLPARPAPGTGPAPHPGRPGTADPGRTGGPAARPDGRGRPRAGTGPLPGAGHQGRPGHEHPRAADRRPTDQGAARRRLRSDSVDARGHQDAPLSADADGQRVQLSDGRELAPVDAGRRGDALLRRPARGRRGPHGRTAAGLGPKGRLPGPDRAPRPYGRGGTAAGGPPHRRTGGLRDRTLPAVDARPGPSGHEADVGDAAEGGRGGARLAGRAEVHRVRADRVGHGGAAGAGAVGPGGRFGPGAADRGGRVRPVRRDGRPRPARGGGEAGRTRAVAAGAAGGPGA